ncbi:MAG TPA: ATP synthase F1 subunit epsilon [Clostridium sp.]
MAKTFKLKILSLDKVVLEEEVEKVFVKTVGGELEILCNHASIIISTIPCVTVIFDKDGNKIELATSKGVINMVNNELTFCLGSAELAEEIDLDRAKDAKERAEERIKDSSNYDVERAKLSLARAITRINFKEHLK